MMWRVEFVKVKSIWYWYYDYRHFLKFKNQSGRKIYNMKIINGELAYLKDIISCL